MIVVYLAFPLIPQIVCNTVFLSCSCIITCIKSVHGVYFSFESMRLRVACLSFERLSTCRTQIERSVQPPGNPKVHGWRLWPQNFLTKSLISLTACKTAWIISQRARLEYLYRKPGPACTGKDADPRENQLFRRSPLKSNTLLKHYSILTSNQFAIVEMITTRKTIYST